MLGWREVHAQGHERRRREQRGKRDEWKHGSHRGRREGLDGSRQGREDVAPRHRAPQSLRAVVDPAVRGLPEALCAPAHLTGGAVRERVVRAAERLEACHVGEEDLELAAQKICNELLQSTRMGLNLTKEALNFGVDAPSLEAAMAQEDRHQVMLSMTEDALEAISAFNEDRSPKFKDK